MFYGIEGIEKRKRMVENNFCKCVVLYDEEKQRIFFFEELKMSRNCSIITLWCLVDDFICVR